jgi:hypothetical protein
VLIVVASYTANLASFLTLEAAPKQAIKGIDDVLDLGATLCYTRESVDHAENIRKKYPALKMTFLEREDLMTPALRTAALLGEIQSKTLCAVGMLPSKFVTQAEDDGSFCPFEKLGEELLEIRSGLPLSSDR